MIWMLDANAVEAFVGDVQQDILGEGACAWVRDLPHVASMRTGISRNMSPQCFAPSAVRRSGWVPSRSAVAAALHAASCISHLISTPAHATL